jgi:hypothetical protein
MANGKARDWFIYRGAAFLAAYRGTLSQAQDWAFEQFGIGCTVLPAEH